MNDVIVQSVIEAHSERWNRFTQTGFVCLGKNYSVDRLGELIREALEFFLGSPHGRFCA